MAQVEAVKVKDKDKELEDLMKNLKNLEWAEEPKFLDHKTYKLSPEEMQEKMSGGGVNEVSDRNLPKLKWQYQKMLILSSHSCDASSIYGRISVEVRSIEQPTDSRSSREAESCTTRRS